MKVLSLSMLTPTVLTARLRGYKWILAGQLTVMVTFLFLYELFSSHPFPYWRESLIGFVGTLMLLMNYLSYLLVVDLSDSKVIQKSVMVFLYTGVILGIVTGMELVPKESTIYRVLMTISISSSLISFIVLFFLMTTDIFREKHDISYRLWGSACIYLGIAATFGLLYCFIEIVLPGEFALSGQIDIFHFIYCYNFSYYTLAGIEPPMQNISPLVKNLSVIESICSNLFIVLIVGRLLSR